MPISNHLDINEHDDITLVKAILQYLAGQENAIIKATLLAQSDKYGIACKDRYEGIKKRTMTQTHQYEDCVTTILNALSISSEQQTAYMEAPNLYVLLKKLQPKHRHLAHLIQLIDETKPSRSWAGPFFFAAVAIAGLATLLSFKKSYLVPLSSFAQKAMVNFLFGLERTLKLASNTPLLGLLSNGIALLWAWRQAFADGLELDHDKSSVLFMRTVEYVFPMIACLLCFFAAGVMTIPALSLFIVGSAIDAVEGIYSFAKHAIDRRYDPLPTGSSYYEKTSRARDKTLRDRDINVLLINLAATLLITASVVVWCLFPISWVITVSCVVCGWLVGMSKGFSISHINRSYANKLQRTLENITAEHSADNKGLPLRSIRSNNETLIIENETLIIENETLIRENKTLSGDLQIANQTISNQKTILSYTELLRVVGLFADEETDVNIGLEEKGKLGQWQGDHEIRPLS